MATRLDPQLPAGDALRAALEAELDAALDRVEAPLTDEDVHALRKHGKRIRALLALAREDLGGSAVRDVGHAVRDAARVLGPLRDARVQRDLLATLPAAEADLALAALPALPPVEHREPERRRARSLLLSGQLALAALDWRRVRLDGVDRALHRSWGAAQRGLHEVRATGDGEEVHAWRKAVKRLGYQVKALTLRRPDLGALIEPLSRLGEVLGAHNDACVLMETVGLMEGDHAALLTALGARREARLIEARDLGGQVLEGPSRELVARE